MSSLDKVFLVIEAVISKQNQGATFTEVQAATGLAVSTVHRQLKGLMALGYLAYTPETKRYKGSLKMAGLGAEIMANFNLREHVHPFLLKMNSESGFASNAAIIDEDQGIYIDKVATKDLGIKLIGDVGKRFQLHCTAMGKILLAHSDDKIIRQVLARPLQYFTPKTITDPKVLRNHLDEVRQQGYAVDNEEVTYGIMCVAAPVTTISDEVKCSLSVAFPSYITSEKGMGFIVDMVKRYAYECSGFEM
jgi:DNA-binding IclR family transcriptional regulator